MSSRQTASSRAACRQIHFKNRSLFCMAGNFQKSSMAFNDALDRGETQSSALAEFFGGKKRLENLLNYLGRHPMACVGDGEDDVCALYWLGLPWCALAFQADVAGFKGELPTSRHGIARVDAEIH